MHRSEFLNGLADPLSVAFGCPEPFAETRGAINADHRASVLEVVRERATESGVEVTQRGIHKIQ